MRKSWTIASNTFKEIIRDRILYGLGVFSILIIGLSLALGQLSFTEQTRISLNFGLTAIHLSAVAISIFIGSSLVYKEIDKQTIMTLLCRPVSRFGFLLGKYVGLFAVIAVSMVSLTFVLFLVLLQGGYEFHSSVLIALYGICLEALVLLALAMFLGTFTRPISVVSFSVGVFLIGHWQGSLRFFSQQSESVGFRYLTDTVGFILPDLETFNWRGIVLMEEIPSLAHLSYASGYALVWIAVLIMAASMVFERADLV